MIDLSKGDTLRVKSGIIDNYRGAGFSRWYVESAEGDSIRLARIWLNQQYTRTIEPRQLTDWEKCTPPTAWAP